MTLDDWLQTIEGLHPTEIDLGLDRVQAVAQRMGLSRPAPRVITVAGTNGKGSCVAVMEAVAQAAGWRTAAYTSPHIHRYNERLRLQGQPAADALWCDAFAAVDAARGGISLTYFEFGTLAALRISEAFAPDLAILEVGMGGRLDAVNIIDPDVAVIASVDLDHQAWLGNDREQIGGEKSGILRPGRPAVVGDLAPPDSVRRMAEQLGAPLWIRGRDYDWQAETGFWWGRGADGRPLGLTALPTPALHLANCATALQALWLTDLLPSPAAVRQALSSVRVPGRFERRSVPGHTTTVILDVGHNPAAGRLLAEQLAVWRAAAPGPVRVAAVLAMLADKDADGFVAALESQVDIWYIARVQQPRARSSESLAAVVDHRGLQRHPALFEDPLSAWRASMDTSDADLVLVTGSFFTVAAVREALVTGERDTQL